MKEIHQIAFWQCLQNKISYKTVLCKTVLDVTQSGISLPTDHIASTRHLT